MKQIKSDLTDVVLVCRKCAKKLKRAFGPQGELSLPKALRAEIARREGGTPAKRPRRKGAHVAVIEIDCLDICPKNAAVVVSAGDPSRWRVVPRGADLALLLDDLAPVRLAVR